MTKFGESQCALCGRTFLRKHPAHKYCHWQCQTTANRAKREHDAHYAEAIVAERKERVEVISFLQQLQPDTPDAAEPDSCGDGGALPRGRYVYAWFNDDSPLPFYIGKGVDDRAWRRHVHSNDGRSQLCQQVRCSSAGFRVEIVRDNMTNEGAMLVESALIRFVACCGGLLTNQVDPLCRKELPPLELESAAE